MMWYEADGKDRDVVVSSRVRLARNLTDYPFGTHLDDASAKEIIEKVKNALKGYRFTDYTALPENKGASDVEKHKVSTEFARSRRPRALLEDGEKQIYIMVNEEDHIRIQSIMSGFALEEALIRAREADSTLDTSLCFAYNDRLGYLTHCPTNLGTGMRASVMLFLPALTAAGGIRTLSGQLGKIGLTIRGMKGEGSQADACLYQISNQITLGITEEEIVSKITKITENIIKKERELRGELKKSAPYKNRVMRAYGTMMYATLIDTTEMLKLYSDVRLGISLGFIEGATESTADEILVRCMPATVMTEHENIKTPEERDGCRADTIREILGKAR